MKSKPRWEGCSGKDSYPHCSNITVTLSGMRCFHLLFLSAAGKVGFPNLLALCISVSINYISIILINGLEQERGHLNNSGLNWYCFLSSETVGHKMFSKLYKHG